MTETEYQAQILELKKKCETLETEKANAETERAKFEKENTTLRDVNQQYFLRLTEDKSKGQAKEEEEEKTATSADLLKELGV